MDLCFGWYNLNEEDACIYDSLPRSSVNQHLGDQLARMLPDSIQQKPIIKIRVVKTHKQDRTFCGYYSCAFATALCYGIDVETISFEEDKLIEHYI